MLTKVILEGEMGDEFGREWSLKVSSPREALALVNANKPGVYRWIRNNLERFKHYCVICERRDGVVEQFDKDQYEKIAGDFVSIKFVPLISGGGGNGGILQAILGIVLIVVGVFAGNNPYLISMGVSMLLGGIVQMLSPRPKVESGKDSSKPSYYFNGPVNTVEQGIPVQLIYGRVLVGSHVISAALDVDQMLEEEVA